MTLADRNQAHSIQPRYGNDRVRSIISRRKTTDRFCAGFEVLKHQTCLVLGTANESKRRASPVQNRSRCSTGTGGNDSRSVIRNVEAEYGVDTSVWIFAVAEHCRVGRILAVKERFAISRARNRFLGSDLRAKANTANETSPRVRKASKGIRAI